MRSANLSVISSDLRQQLKRLSTACLLPLYKHTILMLSIIFIGGTLLALWHLSHVATTLVQSVALQGTIVHADSVAEARSLYASDVVKRVFVHDIEVTHDYLNKPGAIPLPITFSKELGRRISSNNPGMVMRSYSDYPFPWRTDGGARDDFGRQALVALQANPQQPYYRFEDYQGRASLRYAKADVMKESCIGCHNSRPDSPKRDWKVGDVRGVLEITRPLDSIATQSDADLRDVFILFGVLLTFGLGGIALAIRHLRRTSVDLEYQVVQRTLELDSYIQAVGQHALISVADLAGRIIEVNDRFCEVSGYSRSELLGQNHNIVNSGVHPSAYFAELWATISSCDIWRGELCNRSKNGALYWVDSAIMPSKDSHGKLTRYISVRIDITERKRAELRLKALFDNSPDALILLDCDGNIVEWNDNAVAIWGYERSEVLGNNFSIVLPPQELGLNPGYRKCYQKSENILGVIREMVGQRKDGSHFPLELRTSEMVIDKGSNFLVSARDITEKKKSEELIWQHANFDTLTGLPNRRMFYDRLEQEIKKSHRSGLPMALMLLDLDHFKEVNDTLGHAQGDVLLIEAARRIAECVRESDTVARLGGDEFTVILSEVEDTNSVERIAQNIVERLAIPFQLQQETAYVSASVGIALYPNDALNIDNLITNADQAMYVAKDSGRNRFSYFTAALQEATQNRLRLLSDLRSALAGKQLEVHYQPIVEMSSGKIYKAEALLRWQHPERGMVSPAQLIPLAEESGLIHEIGDWVFREAARELKQWRERFVPEFQVSVNVSPVQLRKNGADNVSSWIAHLHALDLPGHSLAIEITEGLLLNAEINVTDKLLAFRDTGIQVSLDDFGTGYSSLSYLKKFDIDYLKIDQSFVRNLGEDMNDQAVCEAIIVMAHKLGLKVIAEGVETELQRDLLAVFGCDYAQGWLYSKALPAGEFEALLQRQGRT